MPEGHTLTWKAASSPLRVTSPVGSLPSRPQGSSRPVASPGTQGARNCSSNPKVQRPFWPLNPPPSRALPPTKATCLLGRQVSKPRGRPGAGPGPARPRRAQEHPRRPGAQPGEGRPRPSVTAENPSVSRLPRSTASLEMKSPSPQLKSTGAQPAPLSALKIQNSRSARPVTPRIQDFKNSTQPPSLPGIPKEVRWGRE